MLKDKKQQQQKKERKDYIQINDINQKIFYTTIMPIKKRRHSVCRWTITLKRPMI